MSNEQAIAESTTKVYLSNIGVIARSMGYKDVPTSCLCLRLGLAIAAWLDNYKAFKWAIAAKEVGPLSRPTVSGCEGVAGDYSGVKSLAGDFLDEWMQNLADNFR